jgi:hypothetical protein
MSAVNPASDEVVPGYAFRSNTPVLWFRWEGKDMPFYFSTTAGETVSEIVGAFFIPQNTPRNGWR